MTSSDPSASPAVDDVTVDHADIRFPPSGTAVTVPISPPAGHYPLSWVDLVIRSETPAGTSASVAVQDSTGTPLIADQPLTNGQMTISLTSIPATSGPLVCVFTLTTTPQSGVGAASPKLDSVQVDYVTTQTPSSLTLVATPQNVLPGGTTVLSGDLMSGIEPLAGQTVTILSRTAGQTSFTEIGTAVTATDGSFALSGPVTPTDDTFYKAVWPGGAVVDTAYPPAVAVTAVYVGQPSTLTLTPSVYVVTGDSPLLLGRLTGGAKPLPGQTVIIESSPAGLGSWTIVGTTVTAADGSYSFTAPTVTAATDFRVRWPGGIAGGVDYTPSSATAATGIGSASSVTIAARAKTITYGAGTSVSGSLLGGATGLVGQTLVVQAAPAGTSTWTTLGTVITTTGGVYTKSVSPKANTVYRVVWLGDKVGDTAYAAAAASATVNVKAKVSLKLKRYVSKVGAYYRYRYGSKVAVTGSVTPNHYHLTGSTATGAVSVKVYKSTYSKPSHKYVWKLLTTSRRSLNSRSAYSWSWLPKARGKYRLTTYFAGDSSHVAATSVYRYVKVY
jgi:hypothetical protein